MKADIHPQYYPEAKVTCACGNTFVTGSTKPVIKVEICANCHPFFTGEMKYVDTAGRVELFRARQAATSGKAIVSKKQKKLLKKQQIEQEEAAKPKNLRELFEQAKSAN